MKKRRAITRGVACLMVRLGGQNSPISADLQQIFPL
ncbi:hypothetical protein R615_01235 [Thalassolituus oleivorans R6-15]|nr:hypothetical protein R615_01235 [Thalassolituus oleivorans R6-15]